MKTANIINVDSDSDDISDIQELPITILHNKVNKHRNEASAIWLSTKKDANSGSMTALEYLKHKKDAYSIAADLKKVPTVLFCCELFIFSATGKRIHTCVIP